MRRLSDEIQVKAPSSFALAFVNTYFLERGAQGTAKLALRFPLPNILIDGLTIEKVVSLKLEYGAMEGGAKPVVIGWQPVGTKALPGFSGTLSAVALHEDTCRVTIAGEYAPPGGIFGTIFDNVVGVRIARATLHALLSQFALAIEADYAVRLFQ